MSELWIAGEHHQISSVGDNSKQNFEDWHFLQLHKGLTAKTVELAQVVAHCCLQEKQFIPFKSSNTEGMFNPPFNT